MKVKNPEFFQSHQSNQIILNHSKEVDDVEQSSKPMFAEQEIRNNQAKKQFDSIQNIIPKDTMVLARQTMQTFLQYNRKSEAKQVEKIIEAVKRNCFTVAVVGEFSRGKSTFINRLLHTDILPEGNMPTTAIMTKIQYYEKNFMMHVDEKGVKSEPVAPTAKAWENLTVRNLGGDNPKGTAVIGVKSQLLHNNNLELIDTPGAGDLEDSQAKCIGDVLLGSDGVIITVSATCPLSESELLFINQRLIAKKTPHLLLVITKLDQIPVEQRAELVEYILSKLLIQKWDIPVIIPYEVEIPDNRYADMMGLDKVEKEILSWIYSEDRAVLSQVWLLTNLQMLVAKVQSSLKEQEILAATDETERQYLIEQKKQKLRETDLVWGNIQLEMEERCSEARKLLQKKTDEYITSVTERLQYEAKKSSDPKRWWEEDFPYRFKIELTSAATGINNVVTQKVCGDAKWYNQEIEQKFKQHVLFSAEEYTEKEIFLDAKEERSIELIDLSKKRNVARVVQAAVTVGGAFALSALLPISGPITLIATSGLGTGMTIASEKMFKGKIENQRRLMSETIEKNVKDVFYNAIGKSEQKITKTYEDLICAAKEQEKLWMKSQEDAIERSQQPKEMSPEEEIAAIKLINDQIIDKLN